MTIYVGTGMFRGATAVNLNVFAISLLCFTFKNTMLFSKPTEQKVVAKGAYFCFISLFLGDEGKWEEE